MHGIIKKTYTALLIALALSANSVCAYAQPMYGDADHSGTLTAYDAAEVLVYTLNPTDSGFTEEDIFYCDVNSDGKISAADAAYILQKVLDGRITFPVDENASGGVIEIPTSERISESATESTTHAAAVTTTEATTHTTTEAATESTTQAVLGDDSIAVNGNVFTIGQSEGTLPAADRVSTAPDGISWHSYCSDVNHYTKVGAVNGKVVQIYTCDLSAAYDGIKMNSSISGYSSSPALYKAAQTADINIYFDTRNSNKVYAIQLKDADYLVKNYDFSQAKAGELEQQIFDMTNAFRAQNGVSSLRWSDDVAAVARAHAEDMAQNGYFSHMDLEGKRVGNYKDSEDNTVIGRMESSGLMYFACGENIDAGYYTAEAAMNGWINSEKGHRENLLGADFRYLGVGIAYNANDSMGFKTRFVQNFYTPAV